MADNSISNKRIAKNSILLTTQMVIVLLLTLYITRVILNILGVEDYGVYNVVCGFVSMFAFLNTSMSNGIQRFYNFELGRHGEKGATKVYNSALLIQFILLIVIIIVAETFGLWYMQNKMVIPPSRIIAANWIFQMSILSFAFVIMQAPFLAAILAHERMGYYAAVSVIDVLCKLLIVIAIPYLSSDSLIVYGFLSTLISILNFLLYFAYCKKNFAEIRLEKVIDKELFLSMLGFSGWNVFGSFSNMMKEQGINLVLNLFFGPIINAARGVAVQVNGGLQSFVSNLSVSIRPQMVQAYAKGEYERSLNLMFTISKLSCMCLYLVALPILVEIDFILKIWLGDSVPEHTNTFIVIIVLTSFVNNLNAAVSNLVHATGQMRSYQLCGGFCTLLSIPLAYVFLSLGFESEWALIMALFSMVITQVVSLFILRSIVPFDFRKYIRDVIHPFLIVVLTTIWVPCIIYNQLHEGFYRFIAIFSVSGLCVIGSIYKFGLSQEEKKFIKDNLQLKKITK